MHEFSDRQFSEADFQDIQGLVRFGHGHLSEARFFLLNVADAAAARAWLKDAPITTAATSPKANVALQVAFTYEGLKAVGVPDEILRDFSDEFIVGMAGDESRSRRLGDVGPNDPKEWRWGQPGKVPHLMVLLYAATAERLESRETEIKKEWWQAAFAELIPPLFTNDIGDIEPFGFKDGVSQPSLDWERKKPSRLRDTLDYTNMAALGEFLLGYPNEYARYTDRPLIDPKRDPERILPLAENVPGKRDFGRNGTYLVCRDLAQDVPGFWQYVEAQANHDLKKRWDLAHAMVGRTVEGDPIVRLRPEPIDGVATDSKSAWHNQFTYENDPDGTACPFGAHIRRANPRNADLPPDARRLIRRIIRTLGFGSRGPRDDLLSSTRFHRILRRGREYGRQLDVADILGAPPGEGEAPSRRASDEELKAERGLRFICLNANISRQFEFIQTAWMANPKFDGLDERDPLVGGRAPAATGMPTDRFTRPQDSGLCARVAGLSDFVTVRGGAYFFMPGISALRYIARIS
jgi:deferrochelatase/peroxidase EfeB